MCFLFQPLCHVHFFSFTLCCWGKRHLPSSFRTPHLFSAPPLFKYVDYTSARPSYYKVRLVHILQPSSQSWHYWLPQIENHKTKWVRGEKELFTHAMVSDQMKVQGMAVPQKVKENKSSYLNTLLLKYIFQNFMKTIKILIICHFIEHNL